MKIIHCADVHLGSQMKKLPRDKSDERARELRATFERMIAYAKREGISCILLAGDVFDGDRPFKKDKEFFYGATTAGNCVSLYSSLKPDPNEVNIVIMHGQEGESFGECAVNIPKLKNKGVDYLALGHVHTYRCEKLDSRGMWAYSGCLEGRGFDETGEKGFVVYDTAERTVRFVPFALRTVVEKDVDISGSQNGYDALSAVKAGVAVDAKNLLRLNLTGEIPFIDETLAADVEKYVSGACYFVSVKNKTRLKIDYSALEDSLSLKGEFVRLALAEDMDGDDRQKIIDLGLKALTGSL